MSESIRDWVRRIRLDFPFSSGDILDIGSLNVNGNVRDYFNDAKSYTGIDFRSGKDVDIVMNAHDLRKHFDSNSFDTVFCMDMLEHDDKFWITCEQINSVLKPGGYLIIVQPTIDFPIHKHPNDYWRATEAAFRDIYYKDYYLFNLQTVYTKDKNGNNYDPRSNQEGINPVLCALGGKL